MVEKNTIKIGFSQDWIGLIEYIGYKARIGFSTTIQILLEMGIVVEYYAEHSTETSDTKLRGVCKDLMKAKPSLHRTRTGKVSPGLNIPGTKRNKPTTKNLVQKPVRLSTEIERYLNAIQKTNPRMTKAKLVRELLEYGVSAQLTMNEMEKSGKIIDCINEFEAIRTTRIRKVIPQKSSLEILVDLGMHHDFKPGTYTRITNPNFKENVILSRPLISNSKREMVV